MAETSAENNNKHTNKTFLIGLARAFAGAIIFAFPMIMTMEMWALGFSVERYRLMIFMTLAIPLLIGMSYFIGFEDTSCFTDDVIDAFVAYAVGFITSGALLFLFGVFDFSMSWDEIIGIISIQAVVAAIGALLAQSELGNGSQKNSEEEKRRRKAGYGGEMFLMMVGAVFLGMNPAPTEEIILIGFKMTDWQAVLLAVFIIILMHAFVYKVEFRGQEKRKPAESPLWSVFLRYTIVGYALVLIISLYLVWTFGHIDGLDGENIAKTVVVMSFPAALGASASRLIL
ncbi:MAG: TIGR02587 family membrane protein [Pyrinomonadaceae bacterium]|nr:TIGR02587 family membrane protein [Pyrinomonadaceae bacterium]